MRGIRGLTYEKRLKALKLQALGKRRLRTLVMCGDNLQLPMAECSHSGGARANVEGHEQIEGGAFGNAEIGVNGRGNGLRNVRRRLCI